MTARTVIGIVQDTKVEPELVETWTDCCWRSVNKVKIPPLFLASIRYLHLHEASANTVLEQTFYLVVSCWLAGLGILQQNFVLAPSWTLYGVLCRTLLRGRVLEIGITAVEDDCC